MTMQRALVLLAMIFTMLSPARAATPQQVDDMLAKAKAFLYSKQHNGNWEMVDKPIQSNTLYSQRGAQWGGLTSLSVYALLASGERATDAQVAPAIEWLKKA